MSFLLWHDIIHNHLTTAIDHIIRTCLCRYLRITIVLRVKHIILQVKIEISIEHVMNSRLKIVNNFWINHYGVGSITCFINGDSILIFECQYMITREFVIYHDNINSIKRYRTIRLFHHMVQKHCKGKPATTFTDIT